MTGATLERRVLSFSRAAEFILNRDSYTAEQFARVLDATVQAGVTRVMVVKCYVPELVGCMGTVTALNVNHRFAIFSVELDNGGAFWLAADELAHI